MKQRVLSIMCVVTLIITLTMTYFVYAGANIASYASDNVSTNNKNVEFGAYLEKRDSEDILNLSVKVKNDGYFNGEINLENSNFKLKEAKNDFIQKIEENSIILNQINSETEAKLEISIEPIKDDTFNIGLLNMSSNLNLRGIYKNSSDKDIEINATREVKYEYGENNTNENVKNDIQIITNKITKISGEEKRVVQLQMNVGLNENNYPMKEIELNVNIPKINNKEVQKVDKIIKYNTMTNSEFNFENSVAKILLKNEQNEQNNIVWEKQGNETVIITLIYDSDVEINSEEISTEEKVVLYNQKELNATNRIELNNEEKDEIIKLEQINREESIYKGKLYFGIDRIIQNKTKIQFNLAYAENNVIVLEEPVKYVTSDNEVDANVIYNKTVISKESFDKILGVDGKIEIFNQNEVLLETVDNNSEVNEKNNIVIDYTGKEPSSILIKTTVPISEGDIDLTHTKTIKGTNKEIVKQATELKSVISYQYGTSDIDKIEANVVLEESSSDAEIEVDKSSLSTVVDNNVEIKAILKANNEKQNLYTEPGIILELPEEVEEVQIKNINLIYDEELKIKEYKVEGRYIIVYLEGTQTNYKNSGIEGTILLVNANIKLSRKTATKDSRINLITYNQGEVKNSSKSIKIVAPNDITAINNIKDLDIVTIGEEKVKEVELERGKNLKTVETEIEIINSNQNTMENIKVLGTFPTKSEENNIETKVTEGINLEGIEDAKIYYTENESATDDLENVENGWQEQITDGAKVSKYMVEVPTLESGENIVGTYKTEIPKLLDYNQEAKEGYSVTYTNTLTKSVGSTSATTLMLSTGAGPELDVKLVPVVGEEELAENAIVRNGEVIKYQIQVSNSGSEDISDVTIQSIVPTGTVLVKPYENVKYVGAAYYKEHDDTTYQDTIETIKVGEKITKEFEVRVKSDIAENTEIANMAQIKYGDVTKQTEAVRLKTKEGKIRISNKTLSEGNLYVYDTVEYYTIIENISNEKQENVKVQIKPAENLEIEQLRIITNLGVIEVKDEQLDNSEYVYTEEQKQAIENRNKNMKTEDIEYNDQINIGELEAGEAKVLYYAIKINKPNSEGNITVSPIATYNNVNYRSNVISNQVRNLDISISMDTDNQTSYIKTNDKVTYTISIKNNTENNIEGINIDDIIPYSLTVTDFSCDGEDLSYLNKSNVLEFYINLEPNQQKNIQVETVVDYSEIRDEPETITNYAVATFNGIELGKTLEVNHIIEANEKEEENDNENENQNDNNSSENNDNQSNSDNTNNNNKNSSNIANGTNLVTGMAWFDENENGTIDDNEKTLSDIKVKLLNTNTNTFLKNDNGNDVEVATNEKGIYIISNIPNGEYIAIFDYDKTKYGLTEYKAKNINEQKNSDVMLSEIQIENNKQYIPSTDIIQINNKNISGINIGLINQKTFDLRLDKYVNKIIIQDSRGTTVKQYDNTTLAKVELDRKTIQGTTVVIEYKISVTNVGQVSGYATEVVDYIPNDLKFSSELNKDWYINSNKIYNSSLANSEIKPGQTEEVTLTLTKVMTDNNTGRTNNMAEITKDYNDLGLSDGNSTPANKAQGENDMGSADIIISIKTGGVIYLTVAIIILIVLIIIAYLIIRKNTNENYEI